MLAVLTHDPKFDVPLLEVALRLDVAYVGAMGSRRTHDDRVKRLREAGLDEAALARLSSPIGLDLGARTPEETAVSIAAEIVQLRWGGRGSRLARARRADPPRVRGLTPAGPGTPRLGAPSSSTKVRYAAHTIPATRPTWTALPVDPNVEPIPAHPGQRRRSGRDARRRSLGTALLLGDARRTAGCRAGAGGPAAA